MSLDHLSNIPAPDRQLEARDNVLDWLQTNVLKLIGLRLVPLLAGWTVLQVGLAWLQDAIGLDLPPAVVASWVGTAIAGLVAVMFAYIRNHGQGVALVTAELLHTEALEASMTESTAASSPPPGTPPPFEDEEAPLLDGEDRDIGSTAGTPPLRPE